MKKISLKNLNLKEVEQLSREQLKNVLGGWTGGTGGTVIETDPEPKCEGDCYKFDSQAVLMRKGSCATSPETGYCSCSVGGLC